ncbi:MAG: DNA polymerase I [Ardenticatenales bacterium]|nr:DNA polymerase I [Ardenticatenales bacterium]
MAKLVLLDGHSLAYRAYHALPEEMATTSGEQTNATFGFTSMLLEVLEREKPEYIAVAFDLGKTWRHERYVEYKGHRLKAPDGMHDQMRRIQEMVRTFNIPIFTAAGWEADDVLGTLARQAEEQGADVVIVTGDTDAHQLVTEHVYAQTSGFRFREFTTYDPDAIRAKYELDPRQLIDYKALLGDTSDNIPGVAGVGKKTATTLVQQYSSLEGIYEHLSEIKGAMQKRLEAGRTEAFLSKELVTIDQYVPEISLDLEACRTRDFDRRAVLTLFRALQFTSLIERIPEAERESPPPPSLQPEIKTHYCLVAGRAELDTLGRAIAAAEAVTLDTETDSLDAIRANLVGLAIGVGPGTGYYLPLGHRAALPEGQLSLDQEPPTNPHNLSLDEVREWLNPLLARPGLQIYMHHAKFDLEVLLCHGFVIPAVHHDTMLAAWLINPGFSQHQGLKELARTLLGVEMTEITELIGKKGKNQITMDLVPVEKAFPYACADVDMTSRLVPLQVPQLKEMALYDIFHDVDMPLVSVLVTMERHGVAFDPAALNEVRERLHARMGEVEQAIYGHVGYEFNINSTHQLSEVLFDKLGLDKRKSSKTKHGHYSTAVNVLEALEGEHEIIPLLMEHRTMQKLLSTYVDQLPTMINPDTHRIHTDFSQTSAETGRLASLKPNLQNIPIRTDIGREIRGAFIAPPGEYLLSIDYSQIELRVLAHLSEDAAMIEAFQRGEDIHAATATRLFHISLTEVTKDQRRIAKIINYGLLFGMSAFRLAREASLSYAEADEVLHGYFRSFPAIQGYLDGIISEVIQKGYAETIMGRRRYFRVLQENPNSNTGRAEERAAKNHPIQGSAAEIIKVAMIRIHDALHKRGLHTRMVLQVHDELLFEVPEAELQEAVALITSIMTSAMTLKVPLQVDAKVGLNWQEMESIEEFLE